MAKLLSSLSRRELTVLAGALAAGGALAQSILPARAQTRNAASSAGAADDPFAGLIEDHRQVGGLLAKLESADPQETTALLEQLKRELTAHSVAEENAVYPA